MIFSKRIMSSTGLDFNAIDRAISYLRNDSAKLDEWLSSEEGSTWLEENGYNTDDDEYDDGYDDDDESYYGDDGYDGDDEEN